jgi:hypothetical protein
MKPILLGPVNGAALFIAIQQQSYMAGAYEIKMFEINSRGLEGRPTPKNCKINHMTSKQRH